MTFLVIYENRPEQTKLIVIRTSDAGEIATIRSCHGKFINACNPEIADEIGWLETTGERVYDSEDAVACPPVIVGRFEVIHTGILL